MGEFMKITNLIIGLILYCFNMNVAQESKDIYPTEKGNWLVESSTGFGNIHPGNTGLYLKISNNNISWNIGGEAGSFISKRLSIKLGLGFGNYATGPTNISGEGSGEGSEGSGGGEGSEGGSGSGEAAEGGEGGTTVSGTGGAAIAGLGEILSYKIGVKYYLLDVIPLQVDISGTNVSNYNYEIGLQAGYAFFLGEEKNVSIEPGIRYSIPLETTVGNIDDQFQMNIGLALHF
jgi:hypothetical protein